MSIDYREIVEVGSPLVKSLLENDPLIPSVVVRNLISQAKASSQVSLDFKRLEDLNRWQTTRQVIRHETGKFFQIVGIDVQCPELNLSWQQPIIYQPEIGILGLLCTQINNTLYFLVQLKVEPGNINYIQMSPTIQATRSNFLAAHGGRSVPFLEYFRYPGQDKSAKILVDQLQSEQGSRFLSKRNRNMIIYVANFDHEDIPQNFVWLTLDQIKNFCLENNCVNMDLRTVVSCINFNDFISDHLLSSSLLSEDYKSRKLQSFFACFKTNDIERKILLSKLSTLKSEHSLNVDIIPLNKTDKWNFLNGRLSHSDSRYFDVVGVNIRVKGREVHEWDQPLVEPCSVGENILFIRKTSNSLSCLVQFKLECGNKDILEIAPTIQTSSQNKKSKIEQYLYNIYGELVKEHSNILCNTLQSEEGGRFYKEENKNVILDVGNDPVDISDSHYMWVSIGTLSDLLRYNNFVNIQLRSLLSLLQPSML